jgi:Subtilase family
MADSGKGKNSNAAAPGYVAPDLLDKAKKNPGEKVRVIVTSSYRASDASGKLEGLGPLSSEKKRLNLVSGVVAKLPSAVVAKLQSVPGLSVTPDAKVRLSGYGSSQLWPFQSGNASLWSADATTYSSKMPAIAIVDSGVENRADWAGKIRASVNLTSLPNNSAGDGRGHGTFVAGIAAGATSYLAGAAPTAPHMAWTDSSTEDAAEDDAAAGEGYVATDAELAEAAADPTLAVGDAVDALVAPTLDEVSGTP